PPRRARRPRRSAGPRRLPRRHPRPPRRRPGHRARPPHRRPPAAARLRRRRRPQGDRRGLPAPRRGGPDRAEAPPPLQPLALLMPPLLHTARFPSRWGDQDALGHVNNAAYLAYTEQARIEALDRLLPGNWVEDAGPILAAIRVDFKRPIVYPATVIVRVYGGEPGRTP